MSRFKGHSHEARMKSRLLKPIFAPVKDVVTPNDFQATLFHLFGLDHRQLSYLFSGREQQITAGREARVVREIVAE
jgi:hypothetical protein